MAHNIDEARSWLEQPMTADELRQLLEAVKAALEEHDGPLCLDDLARLASAEGELPVDIDWCEQSRDCERAQPAAR